MSKEKHVRHVSCMDSRAHAYNFYLPSASKSRALSPSSQDTVMPVSGCCIVYETAIDLLCSAFCSQRREELGSCSPSTDRAV